jgi:regulator of sirC expression with transglutaminase-like and TPR domain
MSSSAAINRLRTSATEVGSPLRDFEQRAAAWHSLAAKPPLPEDIREQRLLAENAVKEKQLEEALHYYEVALERYPVWPEGWFNSALIAGELGYYADAVEHMQAYLELMPDAPDAQAARDQVVIWRAKSKS